ncbi:hypothetical protein HID58_064633 [Brassica napus]|uniref:Uncharacterized protein n=1 Tax=Brassica napus TaxID=3708 RepID=A0ABQ7ZAR8_BRANA|nr:hypothetical protein HID58_064633 [Brassica napus]
MREWRKISLPAMLLGEMVNEILQPSQVTRDIRDTLAPKKSRKLRRSTMPEEEDGPKTPETRQKHPETVSSNIKARRKKEKQNKQSEPTSPRARSRIVFKIVSPQTKAEKSSVSPKRVTLQAFISPASNSDLGNNSPKASISSSKKTHKLSAAAKLRRLFSPSRLAMRLVCPMKSKRSGMVVSGLKQRPVIVSKRFSMGRI